MTPAVNAARFSELDPATLYEILRLRVDVFVVEQECAYPELDGRDDEPGAVHLWIRDDDGVAAYLRMLEEPGGEVKIGRVAVAFRARGTGLAGRLMLEAVDRLGDRPCILDAQTYLAEFYERFGFVTVGAEFVEDGIAHVPMRREPQGSAETISLSGARRPV
ncbi:MAG TPA: GNAT family N-acetyltransferase [Jiangellaceae bacterium]|nr:GNAT family N-acetyltransferase [Jiangellaceae bacterium]